MTHILKHLDSDVKLIIDSHTDNNTLSDLRKAYKTEMAKYEAIGNFIKHRDILSQLFHQQLKLEFQAKCSSRTIKLEKK